MAPELPSIRILVVDDDKAILDYMQTLLEADGYHVKLLNDPTQVENELANPDTAPRRTRRARAGRRSTRRPTAAGTE